MYHNSNMVHLLVFVVLTTVLTPLRSANFVSDVFCFDSAQGLIDFQFSVRQFFKTSRMSVLARRKASPIFNSKAFPFVYSDIEGLFWLASHHRFSIRFNNFMQLVCRLLQNASYCLFDTPSFCFWGDENPGKHQNNLAESKKTLVSLRCIRVSLSQKLVYLLKFKNLVLCVYPERHYLAT